MCARVYQLNIVKQIMKYTILFHLFAIVFLSTICPVSVKAFRCPTGLTGDQGSNGINGQSCYNFVQPPNDNCTHGGIRIYCPAQVSMPNLFICKQIPVNGTDGIDGSIGPIGPIGPIGQTGPPGPNNPTADNTGSIGQEDLKWARVFAVDSFFNNSIVSGTIDAENVNVDGTLTVGSITSNFGGHVNMNSITVTGETTLAGVETTTLDTSGLANLNSAHVNNTLQVSGMTTLIGGAAASTLSVSGPSTLNSIDVTTSLSVGSTLEVSAESTLAGVTATTLDTSGLATLNSLHVNGGASIVESISATSLTVAGTPFNPYDPGALTQSMVPEVANTLSIGTLAKPLASVYTNRIYSNFTMISASMSDTGTVVAGALIVNTTALVKEGLSVDGMSNLAGGITTGTLAVSESATINSLAVTSGASIGTTLGVIGTSTLAGVTATTLSTSGLATLESASIGTTLVVSGASTLAQVAASSLSVSGSSTLNSIAITTGATVGTSLAVSGASTLAGVTATTLSTSGLATLNSLGVTNAATVGTTLGVSGTSTLAAVNSGNTAITGTLSASGATIFTAGTASGSTISGTVVVTGGVGISGAVNIGDGLFVTGGGVNIEGGATITGGLSAGSVTSDNGVTAAGPISTTLGIDSTSTTTGSLIVSGGAGVSGAINVGGPLTIDDLVLKGGTFITYYSTGTITQIGKNVIGSGTAFVSGMVGGQVYIGAFKTCTVTAFVSATNITCSLGQTISSATGYSIAYNLVGGSSYGISPTGNLFLRPAGGTSSTASVTAIQIFPNNGGSAGGTVNIDIATFDSSVNYPNARMSWTDNDFGADFRLWSKIPTSDTNPLSNSFSVLANGQVTMSANIPSGSDTAGTLVVTGGVGVSGNLNVGGSGAFTGTVTATAGTGSSSPTTGTVIVNGGVGVSQNVNMGGKLEVGGTTTLSGGATVNGGLTVTNFVNISSGAIQLNTDSEGTVQAVKLLLSDSISTDNGAISSNGAGALTAASLSTDIFKLPTGTITSGNVLTSDGTGKGIWAPLTGGGSVTSVSAADSSVTVTPTSGVVTVAATGNFGASAAISGGTLSLGSIPIVLETLTVIITPAQIFAMTTTSPVTVIPSVAGKFPKVLGCTLLTGGVTFTGGSTPVYNLNGWDAAATTSLGNSAGVSTSIFTTDVPVVISTLQVGIGLQGYLASNVYGTTLSLILLSGTTYSGGGADLTIRVLFYYAM